MDRFSRWLLSLRCGQIVVVLLDLRLVVPLELVECADLEVEGLACEQVWHLRDLARKQLREWRSMPVSTFLTGLLLGKV